MGRNKKLRIRIESLQQRITDHQIKIRSSVNMRLLM